MNIVYKVLTLTEWKDFNVQGVFLGSPADIRDGFIHLSSAQQTEETVARHFVGAVDLVLVAVDTNALGAALRWERSRGGALFPHLFGTLRAGDILRAMPFDGRRPSGLRELLAESSVADIYP